MTTRLVSAHERMPGEVPDREPHVTKPAQVGVPANPAACPRVTMGAVLDEIAAIDAEHAAIRALASDATTGHEWSEIANRLERVQRIASQAARWARTLGMRAHLEQR